MLACPSEGGDAFRKVIQAGLPRVGQELNMSYRPKGGKKRNQYISIVKEDGLEIDGRVYSPSYATVAVMRKAGSARQTANGWLHWKTADGVLIDELYKKISKT